MSVPPKVARDGNSKVFNRVRARDRGGVDRNGGGRFIALSGNN